MNNKFTYASLFAGIGGFESGLNKLGGRNVFASEIDKFARQSYEVLYGVEPSGDITQIESKDIPNHDLLTAGFPCQTFSVAGKRAGMAYVCRDCEHEQTISFNQYADRDFVCELCDGVIEAVDGRGLLFFEVARVARDKQPKVVLLENVKGLVGHDKGRTLDTIVRTLSEIGYVVDFDVLNSKFYGVPQNRERIFIVAVREDIQPHEEWTEESRKGQTVIPKGKRRIHEYKEVKTFNFDFPHNDEVTTILRDVLEETVDERYYLDEEKTATLIEDLGFEVKEGQGGVVYNRKDGVKTEVEIAKTLSASDWRGLNRNQDQTAVIESLPMDCEIRPVLTPDRLTKRQNGRRFKENDEEMFTLTAQDRHGVAVSLPVDREKGRSEDIEFVGFVSEDGIRKGVDESKLHLSRTHKQPNRIHGTNGIHPSISSSEVSGRYYVADDGATGLQKPKVVDNSTETRIRKLTPKECWRLQGFTDEQHDAVERAGISNSQRYKQAGNAVTVNVIEAIGENLLPYLQKGEI